MNKIISLIHELLGIALSGNKELTEQKLEDFVAQFRVQVAETAQAVQVAVTSFFKQVTLQLPKRNLRKYFKSRDEKGIWTKDSDFQAVMLDCTEGNEDAPAETATRYLHKVTTDSTHDNDIDKSVGDRILQSSNPEDKKEACLRLNIMADTIDANLAGKSVEFSTDGKANIMFRYELPGGRVVTVDFGWVSGSEQWCCYGWGPRTWDAGDLRLSSNGEA